MSPYPMFKVSSILFLLLTVSRVRAEVLTLREVEQRVLASDATRGAKARISQADADIEAARSSRRPTITLNTEASAAAGGQLVEVETVDGQRLIVQGSHRLGETGAFTPRPRYGGLLSMQANVFDFGRTASRIRAAEHRARSALTEERALQQDVVRAAREAYLAWTVGYAQVALAERHREEGRARAATIAGGIAEGSRPTAESNTREQDEVALDLEVAEALGRLDHARVALEQLVGGRWSQTAVPDLSLLDAPVAGGALDAALASAALEQRADAALATADSVAHAHAPSISTSAEAGVRGQATSVFPAYRLGVVVTVPLWDGGRSSAQAQSARAEAESLRAQARAARNAHEGELRLAETDLAHAAERLRLAGRLRSLAQRELDRASERQRLGAADLRAVLDAGEHVWRAEVQELAAKADRVGAWLRTQP